MDSDHPGLPAIARLYWGQMTRFLVTIIMAFLFTGSVAALLIVLFEPEASPFFIVAAAAFVIHSAALMFVDVATGAYDPDQTEFASWAQLAAVLVVVGTVISTLMAIASFGGLLLSEELSGFSWVGWAFAAYYPVVDLLLVRNGYWTPGNVVSLIALTLVGVVLDIHYSLPESLPIFGGERGRLP